MYLVLISLKLNDFCLNYNNIYSIFRKFELFQSNHHIPSNCKIHFKVYGQTIIQSLFVMTPIAKEIAKLKPNIRLSHESPQILSAYSGVCFGTFPCQGFVYNLYFCFNKRLLVKLRSSRVNCIIVPANAGTIIQFVDGST